MHQHAKGDHGPEWKLLDSGETFCWTSNEHCMLLVGYDEEKYYFNDPYNNNGVIGYERELVEKDMQHNIVWQLEQCEYKIEIYKNFI